MFRDLMRHFDKTDTVDFNKYHFLLNKFYNAVLGCDDCVIFTQTP